MRVAIVNDVPLAVEAVRRVLVHTRQHQLAWIAHDGAEAVELCLHDPPDLILMDLIMPNMDGVQATRQIMAHTPCPIVVVTADINDNSSKVFEAMGAGALDAVNTPVLAFPNAFKGAQALLNKIETIRRLVGLEVSPNPQLPSEPHPVPSARRFPLIAFGASAGGPAALAAILSDLPGDFAAAIVIVQHVDAHFAQGLANWLDYQTPLEVRLAQEGDAPRPGLALVAGRGQHLVLGSSARLAYTDQPVDCSYRPSVDVFFKTANRFWPGDLLGVLLTGMGRDGAEGLLALRQSGHYTLAQDQASSAVYGMPKVAADLHAAAEILSLRHISSRLKQWVAHPLPAHV
jgi:two-component system response regulator WspF